MLSVNYPNAGANLKFKISNILNPSSGSGERKKRFREKGEGREERWRWRRRRIEKE